MKQYNFNINGNSYEVTINSVEGDVADVTVKTSYKVELGKGAPCTVAQTASQANAAPAAAVEAQTQAQTPAPSVQTPAPTKSATATQPSAPKAGGAGKKVVAPLPGNIVAIDVKVGDKVKAGQQVAVLEAMKMENSIESPAEGVVTEILANVGDAVAADAPLMTIG